MNTKTYNIGIKALKTAPELSVRLNLFKGGQLFGGKNRNAIEIDLERMILTNQRYQMEDIYGKYNIYNYTSIPDKFRTSPDLTTCANMYRNCSSVTEIDLSHVFTDNVTDMSLMFSDCQEVKTLDVSHFRTSKVINMQKMFDSCINLESLDLSNFETSNVTEMSEMFRMMTRVKHLNLSSFDTSKVTRLSETFRYCESLEVLDLTGWDTSKVTYFDLMLDKCNNLREVKGVLDLSSVDIRRHGITNNRNRLPKLEKKIKVKNAPRNLSSAWNTDNLEILSYKE